MDDKEREQWMNLRKAYDELHDEYGRVCDAANELDAEVTRLREVERAAAAVVQIAIVRNVPEWGPRFIDALQRLALLVPGTRNFRQNPLV